MHSSIKLFGTMKLWRTHIDIGRTGTWCCFCNDCKAVVGWLIQNNWEPYDKRFLRFRRFRRLEKLRLINSPYLLISIQTCPAIKGICLIYRERRCSDRLMYVTNMYLKPTIRAQLGNANDKPKSLKATYCSDWVQIIWLLPTLGKRSQIVTLVPLFARCLHMCMNALHSYASTLKSVYSSRGNKLLIYQRHQGSGEGDLQEFCTGIFFRRHYLFP